MQSEWMLVAVSIIIIRRRRTPVIGRVSAGPRKRQDRHPVKTAGHNIFVCLCHRHAWRYPVPVPYHQEYGTIKRMSIYYAKCIGGMHSVQ